MHENDIDFGTVAGLTQLSQRSHSCRGLAPQNIIQNIDGPRVLISAQSLNKLSISKLAICRKGFKKNLFVQLSEGQRCVKYGCLHS